ncbi:hypothetical protein [Acidocella sp.]|uniref:hypothetical protein n=1 Tax=Acidocella sp. TaxID=50710 RepID=UPI003D082BE8
MQKTAFFLLLSLFAASLIFLFEPSSFSYELAARQGWNWPENLAQASMLGQGMWMALLFGGSFAGLLLALIVGGCIGMARNAPPKPSRPHLADQKEAATTEQLQVV